MGLELELSPNLVIYFLVFGSLSVPHPRDLFPSRGRETTDFGGSDSQLLSGLDQLIQVIGLRILANEVRNARPSVIIDGRGPVIAIRNKQ